MENPVEKDDLGLPPFMETPNCIISLVSSPVGVDNPDINTMPSERHIQVADPLISCSSSATKTPPLAALHLVPQLQLTDTALW